MTVTETVCTGCGRQTTVESDYCPDCGAEDPWEEQPRYEFDEEDLPIVVEFEVYDDNHSLWRDFCNQYFGKYELRGSDIVGLPDDFPRMKYCTFSVYFKITEELELEGPFLEEP